MEHLRLKAAKKLGIAEIPVILATNVTEAQVKALSFDGTAPSAGPNGMKSWIGISLASIPLPALSPDRPRRLRD